ALVVHAEQQRAQSPARTFWRRIAADHELLAQAALELDPIPRAFVPIRAVGALADDAFQTALAGLAAELLAGSGKPSRKVERRARGRLAERLLQGGSPLDQRQRALIVAEEVRRIEQHVQGLRGASGECLLQRREARSALSIEHADFAVEPCRSE